MTYPKKQHSKIEDLSDDGSDIFELSDEMMMMLGGGYGYGYGVPTKEPIGTYDDERLICTTDYETKEDDSVLV